VLGLPAGRYLQRHIRLAKALNNHGIPTRSRWRRSLRLRKLSSTSIPIGEFRMWFTPNCILRSRSGSCQIVSGF
jgi:hypothetical protein